MSTLPSQQNFTINIPDGRSNVDEVQDEERGESEAFQPQYDSSSALQPAQIPQHIVPSPAYNQGYGM